MIKLLIVDEIPLLNDLIAAVLEEEQDIQIALMLHFLVYYKIKP